MKTLVIGDVSIDTVIHLSQSITAQTTHFADTVKRRVGGSAAGKALNLDYLGHDVTLVSTIANDDAGQMIRAFFQNTSVTPHWIPPNHPQDVTVQHTNLLAPHDDRISIFTTPGLTPHKALPSDVLLLIKETDVLFLELSGAFEPWVSAIEHPNIWVDLHDYDGENPFMLPYINKAHSLTLSGAHMSKHTQDWLGRKLVKSARTVVMTHAEKGVTWYDGKDCQTFLPAQVVVPIDSDGAGDGFATALWHFQQEFSLPDAIKKAMEIAKDVVLSDQLMPKKKPLTERL